MCNEHLKALGQTVAHVLELAIELAIAYAVLKFFGDMTLVNVAVGTLILAALAKFSRASDLVPVPDYVNGKPLPKTDEAKETQAEVLK